MNLFLSRILLLSLLLTPVAAASPTVSVPEAESERRIWTSQAGSGFEGYLKRIEGKEVVLMGAAGREIKVQREQLSGPDRAYISSVERRLHESELEFYRSGVYNPETLPERIEISGIQHVRQWENFCVPASAEMVLRFHGFNYDQEYLARLSSRDSSRSAGTNFSHLAQGMRNLGIDSVGIRSGPSGGNQNPRQQMMDGIRAALANGRPVIISYETSSSGHAVVAVGYDNRRRSFLVVDPAAGKRPERLDYRAIDNLLTGALVAIPRPANHSAGNVGPESLDFLRTISDSIRTARADALRDLAQRLTEDGIHAQFRDANRVDLRSSQGQTRSFARQEGVDFVRLALSRGLVIAAPQNFDEGPGIILIFGTDGNEFQAVEYRPDGSALRGTVRVLDFALRWPWRDERQYSLPLVEIERSTGA